MITVYFHGLLKEYGESFTLDVHSPAEAVKALCTQLKGLEQTLKKGSWHVLRGKLDEQDSVGEEALTLGFGEQREMHLMPAVEGAGGGGGVFQVVLGIILVVVAIWFPPAGAGAAAMLGGAGAGMIVGGIVMMTTKTPSGNLQAGEDQKASFLLSRPSNSATQGVPIPRGYGRCMVGSVQVSVSVVAEDIKPDSSDVLQNAVDAALGVWRQR